MKIQSPYGTFMDVLRKVRENALLYQSKLSKSEASTRIVLIDPVLRSLGWDTLNPNMIDFEKTLPQSRADYALYNCDGKIEVIIEAKVLGGNLGDKGIILNLIMYAIAAGVRDIFLTDGVVWEHYCDFAPGNIGSTRTLDLTRDNLLDCTAYLIQKLDAAKYWPSGETGGEVKVDDHLSQQILDLRTEISNLKAAMQAALPVSVKSIDPPAPEPNKPILPPAPVPMKPIAPYTPIPVDEKDFVTLEMLPGDLSFVAPPKRMRLPDGSVITVYKWADILLEACRFVLASNPSIHIPLLDAAGKKVRLLDFTPPAKGISYKTLEYNHRQVYMYSNYDSSHCVSNAIYLFNLLAPELIKRRAAVIMG